MAKKDKKKKSEKKKGEDKKKKKKVKARDKSKKEKREIDQKLPPKVEDSDRGEIEALSPPVNEMVEKDDVCKKKESHGVKKGRFLSRLIKSVFSRKARFF